MLIGLGFRGLGFLRWRSSYARSAKPLAKVQRYSELCMRASEFVADFNKDASDSISCNRVRWSA